jgi:hypothetical protein
VLQLFSKEEHCTYKFSLYIENILIVYEMSAFVCVNLKSYDSQHEAKIDRIKGIELSSPDQLLKWLNKSEQNLRNWVRLMIGLANRQPNKKITEKEERLRMIELQH